MIALEQAFEILGSYAVADVILPFSLFFAIIYSVLKTQKMFEEGNTATVVSLSISLIIVSMHVSDKIGQYDPINILKAAGWQVGVLILSFIFLMMFVMIASPRTAEGITSGAYGGTLIIVCLALVGLIIATSAGIVSEKSVFGYIFDSKLWSFIIAVSMFLGLMWWIGRD